MIQAALSLTRDRSLSLADLNTKVNHEPRISHQRLAEALGYGDASMMPRLIDRHHDALRRFGEVSVTVTETGPKGGRPGKVFWLTKRQCLFICTKSETTNATEVTIQMVEVFDAYTTGKTVTVREHRRKPPAPKQMPLPYFGDYPVMLLDLCMAVQSATTRVMQGSQPDFGTSLGSVLGDLVAANEGRPVVHGGALMDWSPERLARIKPRRR